MRSTYNIDSMLGTRSRLAVLRVLRGVQVPLNASQIATRTGLTRPAVASVLREFGEIGIVRSSSAGQANVHTLNRDSVYVATLIEPLFEAEDRLQDILAEDLRGAFADLAGSVVIFGSYARGDQDRASDVDVVLVARDEEAKVALERAVDDYAVTFRRRFAATFSPVVYDPHEAATLWSRAPALAESLEKDAIVVSGRPPSEWPDDG